MRVTCIVLNWNAWSDTIECVESLLRSSFRDFQIIVVDNGSRDASLAFLERWAEGEYLPRLARTVPKPIPFVSFPSLSAAIDAPPSLAPLIFIRNDVNLGYAGGNNVGIRYAQHHLAPEYIWILNNDTVADRGALGSFVAFMDERADVAAAGARLMQYHEPARIQALGGGHFDAASARDTQIGRGSTDHPQIEMPLELDHVIGASMFVRRTAIDAVGPIEESYFLYREETDWCIRMRKAGWRLFYCPSSIVWHKESDRSALKTMLYDYYSVRNMLYMIQRNYPSHLSRASLAWIVRVMAPKVARMQFRRLVLTARAFLDFRSGVRGMSHVNPDDHVTMLPQ